MRVNLLALTTVLITIACKEGSDSSSKSGDSDAVGVTGQLILEDFDAEGAPDSLLIMKTLGGALDDTSGGTEQLELDSDGGFAAELSSEDETLAALKAAVGDGTDIDREAIKEIIGSDANIDDLSDAELADELADIIEESENQGGPMYLLIGAAFGGQSALALSIEDKADIAESFHFIGLPLDSTNFIGIPAQSAKTDLAMGEISKDTGDEASAELEASVDLFDLTEAGLAQLNNVDSVLKGVKNSFINEDWHATPFFLWNSNSTSKQVINNTYSTPTDVVFRGYGFYVSGNNTEFDFDDICKADEVTRKSIELFPPSEVIVDNNGTEVTKDASTPFDNSGSQTFDTQDGNDTCGSNSFFARDDGDSQIMLNFGTGGSIQAGASIPSGYWRLKYEGSLLGVFDLATASPIGADGKPLVFIPAVKATVNNDGFITKMTLKFYYYDSGAQEYTEITDVSVIERMVSTIEAELTLDDSTGSGDEPSEFRAAFEHQGDGIFVTDTFDTLYKLTGSESDADPVAASVDVAYQIGDNSYRFEFRE